MQPKNIERVATGTQLTADAISYTRITAMPILAAYIIKHPDYMDNPKLAAVIGGLYTGDLADGWLARFSGKLFDRISKPNRNQPKLDQASDKILTHGLIGAIVIREILNRNYGYAAYLAASDGVALARDVIVNKHRDAAVYLNQEYTQQFAGKGIIVHNDDKINTGANKLGKIKQYIFSSGVTMAASPLAGRYNESVPGLTGRGLVMSVIGCSAVMSVVSGFEKVSDMEGQKKDLLYKYGQIEEALAETYIQNAV